jgi:hypothetical protein
LTKDNSKFSMDTAIECPAWYTFEKVEIPDCVL